MAATFLAQATGLSFEQATNLTLAPARNGEIIITNFVNERNQSWYEVADLVRNYGYDWTVNFLINLSSRQDLTFAQPVPDYAAAQDDIHREVIAGQTSKTAVKGLGICPACKKDELIVTSAQKAAGDEGMTTELRCVDCGHGWKIK